MQLTRYKLGDLIVQRREKNEGYDVPIRGVSREGFIKPKQQEADTSIYNVFYRNDFVFNPARMELNSIALNLEFDKALCSSLYEIFYVKDESIVLPEFLNLHIKRDEFARHCEYIGSGSAREYCRVAQISEFDIDLPPIDVQQKIVDANRLLVKRIETNKKLIATLEQTAQTLYRHTFVDNIDPNNLPQGWRMGTVGEFCEVRDGTHDSPKPVEVGNPLVTSAHLLPWHVKLEETYRISKDDFDKINERSLVEKYDILYSMIGTIGAISFVCDDVIEYAVKNMAIFKTSSKKEYAFFLLYFLKSDEMGKILNENMAGSTQSYITLSVLRSIPIVIPSDQDICEFSKSVEPIVKSIIFKDRENQNLTQMQTLLLSKMGV